MRSLLAAAFVMLAISPVSAEEATYAVVLTEPATEAVVTGSDAGGNPIFETVVRQAGYVANIIVLDRAKNPDWSPGAGKRLLPQGGLKIGDSVSP